ncbi:MAG: hypothetical protein MK312_11065, partial [Roseibacillus sp.]|nr:hypothetical protein [Roseibacillus sp.]
MQARLCSPVWRGLFGSLLWLGPLVVQAETSLLRQEQGQQRVSNTTATSAVTLAELVDEFERNGLEGSDVETLNGIQKVIGSVSSELMPRIVGQLKAARTGSDDTARRVEALNAYAGQKSASFQLRQVLLEYQRQLALYQIAERVQALGDRQSANLHEGVALIMASQKPSAARRKNDFAISRQLQQTEQKALEKEVGLVLSTLGEMEEAFAGSLENRPREAMAFAIEKKLAVTLQAACLDLTSDRPMSAASHEKSARDTLWRLVAILQPDRDPLDRLLDALEDIDRLIAGEKALIESTEDLDDRKRAEAEELVLNNDRVRSLEEQVGALERRLENARPEQQVGLANQIESAKRRLSREIEKVRESMGFDGPELSDERRAEQLQRTQAELVDRTDFVGGELSGLAPGVSETLAGAVDPMQKARLALGQAGTVAARKRTALPPAREALAVLQRARTELIAEIEKAEFVEEVPSNKLEQLKALLAKVVELKEGQLAVQEESGEALRAGKIEELKGPQTSAQGDLVEDAERASVAAESPAPEVSQTLGEAAGQMKKSEQSLAIGQNDPLAQQAALDALIQAENQLREEIREMEEAKKALELLEEIRGNLDEVISDQQELQRDTIDEVADPAEVTSAELAGRQDQLGEEVRQLGLQTQSPA